MASPAWPRVICPAPHARPEPSDWALTPTSHRADVPHTLSLPAGAPGEGPRDAQSGSSSLGSPLFFLGSPPQLPPPARFSATSLSPQQNRPVPPWLWAVPDAVPSAQEALQCPHSSPAGLAARPQDPPCSPCLLHLSVVLGTHEALSGWSSCRAWWICAEGVEWGGVCREPGQSCILGSSGAHRSWHICLLQAPSCQVMWLGSQPGPSRVLSNCPAVCTQIASPGPLLCAWHGLCAARWPQGVQVRDVLPPLLYRKPRGSGPRVCPLLASGLPVPLRTCPRCVALLGGLSVRPSYSWDNRSWTFSFDFRVILPSLDLSSQCTLAGGTGTSAPHLAKCSQW